VPAIAPEFALLHGRRADPDGNVVIGTEYDDRLVAQAARHVVFSVEEQREDATRTPAAGEQVVPAACVDALVIVPH
jgi:acyl CoA:acetate/3-ketoacid CoA transferase alpha subunit